MSQALFTLKPPPVIEEVAFSFDGIHLTFAIQRDDLNDPLISGNKWRKLQAFLTHEAEGYQSFGGAWSNHLLAVAALGKKLGKPTVGWLRGDEQRIPNIYERWLSQLGMQLHHVNRDVFKKKNDLHRLANAAYPNYFTIPEGGWPQPHYRAFYEWLEEIPHHYTHYLIGCGSGTTLIGMCEALHKHSRNVDLIGVHAMNMQVEINRLQQACSKIWPRTTVQSAVDAKRFGKISESRFRIAKSFFEQTGIAPDPIYDSSVLLWYWQAMVSGKLEPNAKYLWLLSGGATSWAGFPSECNKLFSL